MALVELLEIRGVENMFANRTDAGQQLAEALSDYARKSNVVVLGLPRGGVSVANEVAERLNADLDVMIVRKLGHPRQKELAVGAIASGGIRVLNESIPVPDVDLEEIYRRELRELQRREQLYRGVRPYPNLSNRCVIMVDDGLATGATMRAAVSAVRKMDAAEIVVAIPVAPPDTVRSLQREVDDVVCLMMPKYFDAIGRFYEDFSQTSDEEVQDILSRAWSQNDAARSSTREEE